MMDLRNCCYLSLITVSTLLLQSTYAQSYHFIIGHQQSNFDQLYAEKNLNVFAEKKLNSSDSEGNIGTEGDNLNSTIIVLQNTIRENSPELSQTAMDIITIVWYVATFLALAAFFMLMACSDRRCNDSQQSTAAQGNEAPMAPPTPAPSYSEFAPPSYDSVVQHASKSNIFFIPYTMEQAAKDGGGSNNTNSQGPRRPSINFYTINELQKLGS